MFQSLTRVVQAQPYRAEINLIIQHYIIPGSPRELNLPYRIREHVLHALNHTTHPTAFRVVRDLVEQCLRHQSHPNFVRWAMDNGRQPRKLILKQMFALTILIYIMGILLLVFSGQSRWLRVALSPLLLLALSQLIFILHGFCMILLLSGVRELRPWEMFASDEEMETASHSDTLLGIPTAGKYYEQHLRRTESESSTLSPTTTSGATTLMTMTRSLSRLNPFGGRNSFDSEPWVDLWAKTSPWKKYQLTFSCEKVAQADSMVKEFHRKVLWQSCALAVMGTILITIPVVCIPVVRLGIWAR